MSQLTNFFIAYASGSNFKPDDPESDFSVQNTIPHHSFVANLLTDVKEELRDKKEHNKNTQNSLSKIGLEISRMKSGSIAVVNQITTVSKLRILDPKNSYGVLSGISLSEVALDKINDKLKAFFIH